MKIKHRPAMVYFRLFELQAKCFNRGKRRWAAAMGVRLRDMVRDNPDLRNYL